MTTPKTIQANELKKLALHYHAQPKPGKIGTLLTKPNESQADLSLAYTPGVAAPILEIAKNPSLASVYTGKSNLVGVITNGSAVLGLGNVGPLASKPVMEGKVVLFKRFADIDGFDIEIQADSPEAFIETVANISPTFGGINLEDIKAPECFMIEKILNERINIPVFHDDQHGTAITVAAGLLNALEIQNKSLNNVDIVFLGVGAAGIASAKLLITLGADPNRLYMVDRQGVITTERKDLEAHKTAFAIHTSKKTLEDALHQADVFIGLSGPNLLTPTMLTYMAKNPIIFALSNPDPEIQPNLAHQSRQDIILATGRSDYPNQINNVLCFPYIFRGALDAKATAITSGMQIAAVYALQKLAQEPVPNSVLAVYPNEKKLVFGKNYILPKPLDPRLLNRVAPAVKQAYENA